MWSECESTIDDRPKKSNFSKLSVARRLNQLFSSEGRRCEKVEAQPPTWTAPVQGLQPRPLRLHCGRGSLLPFGFHDGSHVLQGFQQSFEVFGSRVAGLLHEIGHRFLQALVVQNGFRDFLQNSFAIVGCSGGLCCCRLCPRAQLGIL